MEQTELRTPRARIAWLSPTQPTPDSAIVEAFAAAEYQLTCGDAERAADMVIVDFRGGGFSPREAGKMSAAIRRRSPETGIIYLSGPLMAPAERAHLRRSGELVICDDAPAPVIDAVRRRLRLRAIADETGERLKSISATSRLTEFPPIRASTEAPDILIAGKPSAVALAAHAATETVAASVAGVLSAGQAMRALETGRYAAAVFIPRSKSDPLISLARTMRRHRRFQDVPVIMVAENSGPAMSVASANASEAMLAAHVFDDLPARIATTTRRARLVASMRAFLTACAGDGVRDEISGVFTPTFFSQHGERMRARAAVNGRPFSLCVLRLTPPVDSALCARTMTEAARLINRVCRIEDCVGQLARDTFVIALNGAPAVDAQRIAARLEGVIASTMFRARSDGAALSVAAHGAFAECAQNVRLEETLAPLIASVQQQSPDIVEA